MEVKRKHEGVGVRKRRKRRGRNRREKKYEEVAIVKKERAGKVEAGKSEKAGRNRSRCVKGKG